MLETIQIRKEKRLEIEGNRAPQHNNKINKQITEGD